MFVLTDLLKKTKIFVSPGSNLTDSQLNRFIGSQDIGHFLMKQMEEQ